MPYPSFGGFAQSKVGTFSGREKGVKSGFRGPRFAWPGRARAFDTFKVTVHTLHHGIDLHRIETDILDHTASAVMWDHKEGNLSTSI